MRRGWTGIAAMTALLHALPEPDPPGPLRRTAGERDPHFEFFDVVECT